MNYKSIVVIGLILFLGGNLYASEQRGALILNKIPIFEFESPNKLACIELYDIKYGQNVADVREDPVNNRNAYCQGRYEMTVRGEPGRTVTLYAQFNFGQENGFLVVKKTDDRKVWIYDLESLPPGRWTTVPASHDSGGYEAFYHSGPAFDRNLSSIKWGQWWQGDIPRKTGYQAPGDERSLNR
ncbi:MAG: hypothetical protein OEM27_01565 [Nitrospinota bacterium]|nr:hypothetical protein [Nitrospinota bacterium]